MMTKVFLVSAVVQSFFQRMDVWVIRMVVAEAAG
jgi:hypothetical protein